MIDKTSYEKYLEGELEGTRKTIHDLLIATDSMVGKYVEEKAAQTDATPRGTIVKLRKELADAQADAAMWRAKCLLVQDDLLYTPSRPPDHVKALDRDQCAFLDSMLTQIRSGYKTVAMQYYSALTNHSEAFARRAIFGKEGE